MNKVLIWTAGFALAAGFAVTACAQGSARAEINTARTHALMAQHSKTVDMAHTHLHHVINCLVGPKGTGFDAAAGTPCKGQGHGAIPDSSVSSRDNSALHGKLESALAAAEAGLKSDSLATVQKAAAKVAAVLQAASAQKAGGGNSW